MKYLPHLMLATSIALLSSCKSMNIPPAKPANMTVEGISANHFATTLETDYLLFLPKGYDSVDAKRWPLIFFLHGAGERGSNVWRTAIHGPVNYIKTHPDFPFIMVSPLCPPGNKWSDDILLKLLASVSTKYNVDTNRIYLTGLSMGGFGAWSLATTHPELFAAVAPICGGEGNIGVVLSWTDDVKGPALKRLPIWAFHGAKDPVVNIEESRRMVESLTKYGNTNVNLTVYPEAQHNSWTATYDNPKLYEWFLSHQRAPTK